MYLVKDTVRKGRSRANREDVALEPRAVRVDVVQRRTLREAGSRQIAIVEPLGS